MEKVKHNKHKSYKDERFKFSDYDCIGFDLDNTIARYQVDALIDLAYETLARYMVYEKGYSRYHLMKPVDHDFFLKGLIIDDVNGNVLKINADGKIIKASHGTNMLDEESIIKYYPNQHWEVTDKFVENPLETWNGSYAEQMRTLLDYFDICVSLIFARAVDCTDEEKGMEKGNYKIWPDILEGLINMYDPKHFWTGHGEFFAAIKENPCRFYYKCSNLLIQWLKDLKRDGRLVFMVTGSDIDFASFTAKYTIGPAWKDIFDVVVCFAKKPGFFTMERKFFECDGFFEVEKESELELGSTYTLGNWKDLRSFLTSKSKKEKPKFLYIGDNLIQDIYAPSSHDCCDTVAICEELLVERGRFPINPHSKYLLSERWGSYFKCETGEDTYWLNLVKKYSKMSFPNLESVTCLPLDFKYTPIYSFF